MSILIFDPYKEFGFLEEVRLVTQDIESKVFIHKKNILAKEVLEITISEDFNKKNIRYKYQVKNAENKWKDTKFGYQGFYRTNSKELLKILDFENHIDLSEEKLFQANEGDINYCFKHILLKSYIFLLGSPNKNKTDKLSCYLEKFPKEFLEKYEVASHYYSLMYILIEFIKECEYLSPYEVSKEFAFITIDKIFNDYNLHYRNNVGFLTGAILAKANITSVYDREKTYDLYQKALTKGEGFIDVYLTTEALTTYYKEVTRENKSYSITEFRNYEDNVGIFKTNICFSADEKYFKMFAIGWAQSSFYFKNLSFNFGLITKNKNEFNILVKYYNDLLEKISIFLGLEIIENTRFFFISSSVINKTVYACGRFYLTGYILKNYSGDVFITDIDQLVIGDLEKYLESVSNKKLNIYHPKMKDYYCILPGRSHLAGNIYIKNSVEGKSYTKALIDYVGMGLEEKFSWMLDQNATRYASEIFEVGNLNDLGERVLKQFPNLKRTLRK